MPMLHHSSNAERAQPYTYDAVRLDGYVVSRHDVSPLLNVPFDRLAELLSRGRSLSGSTRVGHAAA